ncbi:MAG: DUF1801 domain-containing protein [Planctomycetota bacterium]|nr:MAG: DUF1801 domain-containing protein [Planctomycetota bacterium]
MAGAKTQRNDRSVAEFLAAVPDPRRREDAQALCLLLAEVTGEAPEMWGDSIVGFGSYRHRYADGREGEWMLTGFSPRKQALSIYVMSGFAGAEDLLARLGPHRIGRACLYLKRLADADPAVLRELIARSVAARRAEA